MAVGCTCCCVPLLLGAVLGGNTRSEIVQPTSANNMNVLKRVYHIKFASHVQFCATMMLGSR
jgi:hypothetical protein